MSDAGETDSGVADATVADTSVADTSVADTSVADTSVADASGPDANGADAGEPMTVQPGTCASPHDVSTVAITESDGTLHIRGVTTGASNNYGCAGHGEGPESVFTYTPPSDGVLLGATEVRGLYWDQMLYIVPVCGAPPADADCSDDASTVDTQARMATPVAGGVPVYIIVDGYGMTSDGEFDLWIKLLPGLGTQGAGGETCATAVPLAFTAESFRGHAVDVAYAEEDTTGAGADVDSNDCNDPGPDRIYSFDLTADRSVWTRFGADYRFESVLYLTTSCDAATPRLVCYNDIVDDAYDWDRLSAGTYYLGADSWSLQDFGHHNVLVILGDPR